MTPSNSVLFAVAGSPFNSSRSLVTWDGGSSASRKINIGAGSSIAWAKGSRIFQSSSPVISNSSVTFREPKKLLFWRTLSRRTRSVRGITAGTFVRQTQSERTSPL